MLHPLTDKQRAVYSVILESCKVHGRPPTQHEIAALVPCQIRTVGSSIHNLVRHGLITFSRYEGRSAWPTILGPKPVDGQSPHIEDPWAELRQ